MRIFTVRRISQIFFFALFLWFCLVSTAGYEWDQMRGWPVNWFLQLDPLVAIGTLLATHTLYIGLAWALATVIATLFLGRVFCSWICPFGSIHHFMSYLSYRNRKIKKQMDMNRYRSGQRIKYYILFVMLVMAAIPIGQGTLAIGLLDPIALVTRSFNLLVLPIADSGAKWIFSMERFYDGAWFVFTVFAAAVLLNFWIPRFYCRFVCPLGALLGIFARFSVWTIGRKSERCVNCDLCERQCQGACEPAGTIKVPECVVCFNCLNDCDYQALEYSPRIGAGGETRSPDASRRGFMLSIATGVFAVPAVRLSNGLGSNWHPLTIRPPGAVTEADFLKRCVKCGQCMRICPSNVIQPAGIEGGIEGLWTPVLNNRIGSSGCQYNCVACGQVCPTQAIRAITIDEKQGVGEFSKHGPVKLGTAFVDRGRCLPWSMNTPCIVCQENCPVSPKAIYTHDWFETVRDGEFEVFWADETRIALDGSDLRENEFDSGDYYCILRGEQEHRKIVSNSESSIVVAESDKFSSPPEQGQGLLVQIRLQSPQVDIEKCIGCGICEHECPVSGQKAIRVTAEGETRSRERSLTI